MRITGTERISLNDIKKADVFCGGEGNFDHLTYSDAIGNKKWLRWILSPDIKDYDLNGNGYWDPGESLKVIAKTSTLPPVAARYISSSP